MCQHGVGTFAALAAVVTSAIVLCAGPAAALRTHASVSTPAELHGAVLAGTPHIEVTQHLDLSALECLSVYRDVELREPDGSVNATGGGTAPFRVLFQPLASTVSIRVRCAQVYSARSRYCRRPTLPALWRH